MPGTGSGFSLGSVQFQGREIPDLISFGGKQLIVVHHNIGGTRILDAMGPDPDDIKWGSKFYGPQAASKARQLDNMRRQAQQVTLTWGSFSRKVLVKHFHALYKHEWEIGYDITCIVVNDQDQAGSFSPSIEAAVTSDLSFLTSLSAGVPSQPNINAQVAQVAAAVQRDPTNTSLAFALSVMSANAAAAMTSTFGTSQPATSVTTTMWTALAAAMQIMASIKGSAKLQDLSIAQLQTIVAAFADAYDAFAVGNGTPAGINLDAQSGVSVLDGINNFTAEANNVAADSDINMILGYLGRIINNLALAGG